MRHQVKHPQRIRRREIPDFRARNVEMFDKLWCDWSRRRKAEKMKERS